MIAMAHDPEPQVPAPAPAPGALALYSVPARPAPSSPWMLTWMALLALVAWVLAVPAWASPYNSEGDLPGRVGRVADVQGRAWFFDEETRRWSDAQRNRSVTEGDRFSTDGAGRLQLAVGSTELRLGQESEISFDRLDDDRVRVFLHRGSLALRVRHREQVREWEVRTVHGRFRPERTGHYRIDRDNSRSIATAWRGSLSVDTDDSRPWVVEAGRSVELMREGRDGLAISWGGVVQDAFSDWVARDEDRDDRLASERWISPEMTGADELDRHGRWDRHPEYGMVWSPLRVSVDWSPFRHGRWTWHSRWGWTWVDDAPWGFATSHYGRWSQWGGRWVWVPGSYVARPAYAPAVVGWVGGVAPGVSVRVGVGPAVGWRPLAPRDVYVPPFRHAPRYVERVNQPHRWPGVPAQVPTGPVMYGPGGTPQGVSTAPSSVTVSRPVMDVPVQREAREPREPSAPRVVGVGGGERVVSMPALPQQVVQTVPVQQAPQVPQAPQAPQAPQIPQAQPQPPSPKVSPRAEPPAPKMHRGDVGREVGLPAARDTREAPREPAKEAVRAPREASREGLRERQERQ
jgi:hypothetical protein